MEGAYISGALPVVKIIVYWNSGCSAIWWSRVLQAVMKKRQVRAVVWVVVLSPTVRAWPLLCRVGIGHGFVPQFLMVLVPMKVGIGSNHYMKLPVISEPSLQWKGVAGRCYDALVSNQLQCTCRVVCKQYRQVSVPCLHPH